MSDFKESLHRRTPSVVVAFASGAGKFEWGRTLDAIGVDHVLMRDTTDRWYLRGVEGIGSMTDTAKYVGALKRVYDRVVLIGLSSGSYAALLYGMLARYEVIAISPITGKGDAIRIDFDPKWWHRIEHGPEHPWVADLKVYARNFGLPPDVQTFISDGEGTELDALMATRIGIANITRVPGYSHAGLARGLVERGIIRELLQCG